ncbi:MAG: hypothetical protein JW963_26355, partial [Anaerolineales bacterium]|nr:hypothetical protein [Anaerolineales bacterium]
MTSILLVLDTSDQQNWGCLATTSALHELLGSTFDDLELSTIQLGTIRKEFRTYNIPLLKGKIFEASSGNYHTSGTLSFFHRFISKYQVLAPKVEFFPQVSDEYDDKAQQWLRGNGGPVGDEFLAKARKSDVVLINEEGCIVEQAKKGTRSLFLGYLAKKYLNKPVFIVNHTAHFKTSVPILLSMGKK